jgi:NDP-sugar pyrophosphorylase family protein
MTRALPAAAILAGGLGTRIRTVAGDLPKVLLPVEGRPFLAQVLSYLAAEGVTRVVVCLGHQADRVADAIHRVAPGGLEVVESREATPLGTGGAIHHALEHLGGTFFIVNGDTFLEAPLTDLLDFHRANEALLTLSLVRSEHAAEKGTVKVAPDGRVLDFEEKTADGNGVINGGIYVAEAPILASCKAGAPCSLERDVIPRTIADGGKIMARVVDAPFVDIGIPEDYLRVRDRLPRKGSPV